MIKAFRLAISDAQMAMDYRLAISNVAALNRQLPIATRRVAHVC